ncbi:MAG: hypothetical protein AAF439_01900 [Pseudomonadota bacterium]
MRRIFIFLILLIFPLNAFANQLSGQWAAEGLRFILIEEDDVIIGDIIERGEVVGSIVGIAKGRRLTGIHVRDGVAGSFQGSVFTDGNRFSLLASDMDGNNPVVWKATRDQRWDEPHNLKSFGKPDQLTFPYEGTWRTEFGSLRIHTIRGRYFVGDYSDRGVIFGVSGSRPSTGSNLLFGTFTNGPRTGKFEFRLDTPEKFTGLWRFSTDTDFRVGWWGERAGSSPEILSRVGNGKSIDTRVARSDPKSDFNFGYHRREEAAVKQGQDWCGPAKVTKEVPTVLNSTFSQYFIPVCERHDACYRLRERTQKFCDDQMVEGMKDACDAKFSKGHPNSVDCYYQAKVFTVILRSSAGAWAFSGEPHGVIERFRARRIEDLVTDDEIEICLDIHNPSAVQQEYEVRLLQHRNVIVDREPDTHEINVDAGDTVRNVCVGTNFSPDWSIGDLMFPVNVAVWADTPSNISFTNDMVPVDSIWVKKEDLK